MEMKRTEKSHPEGNGLKFSKKILAYTHTRSRFCSLIPLFSKNHLLFDDIPFLAAIRCIRTQNHSSILNGWRRKKYDGDEDDAVRLLKPSEVHTMKYASTSDDLHTVNATNKHHIDSLQRASLALFIRCVRRLSHLMLTSWFISFINANYGFEQINGTEWQHRYYKISIHNQTEYCIGIFDESLQASK